MSETKTALAVQRKVTVYPVQGGKGIPVMSAAGQWGQLNQELQSQGMTTEKMKVVVGGTKVNLEIAEAILPEGDFKIFLFPVETKSGANLAASEVDGLAYKDLRAILSRVISTDKAKAYFNEGRNYTTKSTDELKGLLKGWIRKNNQVERDATVAVAQKPAKPAASKGLGQAVKAATANVVAKIPAQQQSQSSSSDLEIVNSAIGLIKGIRARVTLSIYQNALNALNKLQEEIKNPDASGIDNEELDAEARDIARSLRGIKPIR